MNNSEEIIRIQDRKTFFFQNYDLFQSYETRFNLIRLSQNS